MGDSRSWRVGKLRAPTYGRPSPATRDVDGLRKTNARADPMAKPPSLLTAVFGEDIEIKEERPRVTLTFAQSLDAKIAGIDGKQLILSGRESMVMTHW
jgi:hypothetical protein